MSAKSFVVLAGAVLVVAGLTLPGFAQSQTQTVNGHLIDVMCGVKHAPEGAAYGTTHDKSCLLMEACVKSGYSVLTADNKVFKFDPKGNELALALINKTDRENDWRVSVTGTVTSDTIAVSSLSLQ